MAKMLLIAALVGMGGFQADRSVYHVKRTAQPIHIDGKLDDAAWRACPVTSPFANNVDGTPGSYATDARVLYDDQFLYFAFRCQDENLWSTMRQRDQHLWEEEVVEVFLQADPAQSSYIELEVNPLGTMLDIYLVGVRKPLPYASWNSARLRWAVQLDGTADEIENDRGWTVEIALPLEDVVPAPRIPPQPGDRWRLNLYHVQKHPRRAQLAWVPTLVGDFHRPDRFGEIVFSEEIAK